MREPIEYYMNRGGNDVKAERLTARDFDAFISASGLFTIEREVTGRYLDNPYFTPGGSRPRIDRILKPTYSAQERGITLGPIGVELKKQHNGAQGKAIKQAISYRAAKFTVDGEELQLSHVFFGPAEVQGNEIAAVMSQFRVGPLVVQKYNSGNERYLFNVGQAPLLSLFYNHFTNGYDPTFKPKVLSHGGRFGSK